MTSALVRRLLALEKREAEALSDDPHQLTDAQLLKIAGLSPDATDEQIERLVQSLDAGRDHGAG